MSQVLLRLLEERKAHIEAWFAGLRESQARVPQADEVVKVTEWQMNALRAEPPEGEEVPSTGLARAFEDENEYLRMAFPLPPPLPERKGIMSTAVTTGSSANVVTRVIQIGSLPSQEAWEYSRAQMHSYEALQNDLRRPEAVRELLVKLGSESLVSRFDSAARVVSAARQSVGERAGAANAIRNVIHGLEGELFEKARNLPKENMTWEEMVSTLSAPQQELLATEKLLGEKKTGGSIRLLTAEVLKEREGGLLVDVGDLWSQAIDHLYVVLTLLPVEAIRKRSPLSREMGDD